MSRYYILRHEIRTLTARNIAAILLLPLSGHDIAFNLVMTTISTMTYSLEIETFSNPKDYSISTAFKLFINALTTKNQIQKFLYHKQKYLKFVPIIYPSYFSILKKKKKILKS